MPEQLKHLYDVKKEDIAKSGILFTDAFENDPVWSKIFKNVDHKLRSIFFQGPAHYCLKYGEVYAPSENLEGAMAFVPGKYADMTVWRALKSGSFTSVMRGGMKLIKLMGKMKPIFTPLEEARRQTMNNRDYIYLIIIGVSPEFQRRGFGKKLLTALNAKADSLELPIYLETATDKNIKMYEKLGYKVTGKVIHPVIDLPQWGMLREPVK